MSTALNVISASAVGLATFATVVADVTGNTFQNDGCTWLYVDGGTSGGTVTVKSNATLPTGLTVPDKVYTIAASTFYLLAPQDFPYSVTGDTVKVTGSVATIKLAAFH
jgi:6-phosphogluconate dehydrogenase (decarboxylating)